jgi:hypothetical protein
LRLKGLLLNKNDKQRKTLVATMTLLRVASTARNRRLVIRVSHPPLLNVIQISSTVFLTLVLLTNQMTSRRFPSRIKILFFGKKSAMLLPQPLKMKMSQMTTPMGC